MPAVVSVKEGINLPRYPSVPGRMRAKRKPIEGSQPARPPARLKMVRLVLPETSSKQAEVLGRGPEAAPAVVEILQSIGVRSEPPSSSSRTPPTSSASRRS